MTAIDAVVAEVVDKLTAAGLRATADERDLNPPGVYVSARSIAFDRLAGYTTQFHLYAVVPNTGRRPSLAALGPLADQVRAVWDVRAGTFEDLAPLDQGDPWPALRFDLTIHACDDQEGP